MTTEIDPTVKDFTPTGLKLEGAYENDRNTKNRKLYADMIKEAYGADQSIIAHHLTYVAKEIRDGFEYQIVEEIPSADTLIFDHEAARKIWGPDFQMVLALLVSLPVPERDEKLKELYYGREDHDFLGAGPENF
jgi:hypothetical protein